MGRGDVQMARSSASPGQESRKGEVTACVCGGGGSADGVSQSIAS